MGGLEANEVETAADDVRMSPVRRGRRLGRYTLCYELASGGMATVYLARAEGPAGFEKLVAVKVIHPHLVHEPGFIEMFLDEARIAARIAHPNVCAVFDFGETADTYYIAMEYLVGETVSRLMRSVARRPEHHGDRWALVSARIVGDACEGLHAAHDLLGPDGMSLGVVHRDVTPQNIFVGIDGSARVVDFGVASAADRLQQTTAGQLKGKHAFMSPEQVLQRSLDRRADVWSLGVCLWEMLALQRLFRRTNEFETLKAVLEAPLEPPSRYRPHIPPALDAVVMQALERDPERRFQTAREMGRALHRARSTLGSAAVADVADLMQALFAEEHARRLELLDEVRNVEAFSSSRIAARPGHFAEPESVSSMVPEADVALPAASESRRPAPGAAIALVGALLVAGLSVGSWWLFESWRSDASPGLALDAPSSVDSTGALGNAGQDRAPVEPGALEDGAPEGGAPEEGAPEQGAPEDGASATIAEERVDDERLDEERLDGVPSVADRAGSADPREGGSPPPDERARPRLARAERSSRPDPPRRPAPRATAPRGYGVVNVVTPPGWADIYVGGDRVGRSPAEVRLPAGRATLRLLPYGEAPALTRSVEVPADGVVRLSVRLPEDDAEP